MPKNIKRGNGQGMSAVRKCPVAIFLSDIHLSHKVPISRADEPDWYEAQARVFREIHLIKAKLGIEFIFVAGDIFDRWNANPQLINFALESMPNCFAVPGQHDLPFHNPALLKHSAFYTLMKAQKITMPYNGRQELTDLLPEPQKCFVYFFGWGQPIIPPTDKDAFNILISHRYVWTEGYQYPDAPASGNIKNIENLEHYDLAVFGDNHKGFFQTHKNTVVLNCGTLMRRKSDEYNYKPQIGVLYQTESGFELTPYFLDTTEDKISYIETEEMLCPQADLREFFNQLKTLEVSTLDFKDAMTHFLNDNKQVSDLTKEVIFLAMEE